MIKIDVDFVNAYSPSDVRSFTVTGDSGDSFLERLCRTADIPWKGSQTFAYLIIRPDELTSWAWQIDSDLTMSQMRLVSGGHRINVDNGGRGGGIIPMVSDLFEAALSVVEVATFVGLGSVALNKAVNAPKQRAVRAWQTGEGGTDAAPGRALELHVRKHSFYVLSDIEYFYGVDAETAAKLLRGTGFRRLPDDPMGYPESWQRINDWPSPAGSDAVVNRALS